MASDRKVELYDTTLRDGTQGEGISLSVEDKLRITRKLDELGIPYVEGGWPGSNPKDAEYFVRAQGLTLRNAVVAAFAMTRRPDVTPEQDASIRALLDAQTRVVTLVGKSWDLHVTQVVETTLEENLRMIQDSIRFLKAKGRRVFYDAEHYFDGFKANQEYALQCLRAADEAGAERIILCDTNGGGMPWEVRDVVKRSLQTVKTPLGIHCHNDCELAVGNSLAAVEAGVFQVQGTVNGYGERCGNANLVSIIPNLKLKMDISCLTDAQLASLTEVSRFVSEIANQSPNAFQPYVGASAFSHKAGLHASAVAKVEHSYQHIDPLLVGNTKRVLVSELAGRGNILAKARELFPDVPLHGEQARRILDQIKEQESKGFQYEGAEASFELLVRRAVGSLHPHFELVDFLVLVEKRRRLPTLADVNGEVLSDAMVKVRVAGETSVVAAEGNGPVNALDAALRQALLRVYPSLAAVKLVDYKVRIVNETEGTGAKVRVLIESTDGERSWRTVGCSANIIEASWMALADSLEYWLLKREVESA